MASSVDTIKSKLSIVDVVGSYIKLEPSGVNYKAKCPFHNEKTPSFFVSPDRGSFYCFGCQAKGDIFSFVQEFEGLDFKGALKVLAMRAGVSLVPENKEKSDLRDKLFEVMDASNFFFQKNLVVDSEAYTYLIKRGVKPETVKNWQIGYSLPEWRSLYSFLLSKKFTAKEMEKAGLIKKTDKGGDVGYYDTFRGRIIFPIFDTSGRVIAFSGRILVNDEKSPKYLNSPETELFSKSETLYGLDKAKLDIRKKDYAILVEGQMDLIMCHQAGLTNTVASSGTALTVEHIKRIQRLTNRIIVAYDSDKAGFNASNRGALIALSQGMDVKIAQLPEGKDPADMALHNVEELKDILKKSTHIIDFHLNALLNEKLDDRRLGRAIKEKILPLVARLASSIEQSHFVTVISQKSNIKESAIWDDLKRLELPENTADTMEKKIGGEQVLSRRNFLARKIAGIIYWQEDAKKPELDIALLKKQLEDIVGKEIFQKMYDYFLKQKSTLIFEAEAYYNHSQGLQKAVDELFLNFEEDYLKEKLSKLMSELSELERKKDQQKSREILVECQKISKKISELKSRNNIKK